MRVPDRVQMHGHPIYFRCSRQVRGSVADTLSALITEQAQEWAQAHTGTHTHMNTLSRCSGRTVTRNWKHWKNLTKVKETASC